MPTRSTLLPVCTSEQPALPSLGTRKWKSSVYDSTEAAKSGGQAPNTAASTCTTEVKWESQTVSSILLTAVSPTGILFEETQERGKKWQNQVSSFSCSALLNVAFLVRKYKACQICQKLNPAQAVLKGLSRELTDRKMGRSEAFTHLLHISVWWELLVSGCLFLLFAVRWGKKAVVSKQHENHIDHNCPWDISP